MQANVGFLSVLILSHDCDQIPGQQRLREKVFLLLTAHHGEEGVPARMRGSQTHRRADRKSHQTQIKPQGPPQVTHLPQLSPTLKVLQISQTALPAGDQVVKLVSPRGTVHLQTAFPTS